MSAEQTEPAVTAANPAAVAYEAYREACNANATNNTFMLDWAYISENEKKVWWAVVRALMSKKDKR